MRRFTARGGALKAVVSVGLSLRHSDVLRSAWAHMARRVVLKLSDEVLQVPYSQRSHVFVGIHWLLRRLLGLLRLRLMQLLLGPVMVKQRSIYITQHRVKRRIVLANVLARAVLGARALVLVT